MKFYKKPGALPSHLFPNTPDEFTWEDWEEATRKQYPIQWFFRETVTGFVDSIRRELSNIYWWFAHRTTHRFHVLNISNPGGGIDYNVGWLDTDTKLLAACGQMIVRFIEKEEPFKYLDGSEEPWASDHREWRALYNWWTVERPQQVKDYDDALKRWSDLRETKGSEAAHEEFEKLNALELEHIEHDTEMLIRFVRARRTMWT